MNDHLDALGRGLAEAGMSVAPRYEEQPALLRVVRPALPAVVEVWTRLSCPLPGGS